MADFNECNLTPEDQKWVSENFDKIIAALANIEFDEWKQELGEEMELTEANIQKIIDKGWQFWDTYSDAKTLKFIWGVNEGSDRITEEDYFDIGTLIAKLKELGQQDEDFRYNWHQYADWATIFFYFYPNRIEMNTPFVNDIAYDYLSDDLRDGRKTVAELKEIVKNTPDKYYSK